MKRVFALLVLGAAALAFSPATASAQYGPRYGYGFQYSYGGPGILPQLPPLPQLPHLPYLAPLPQLNPFTPLPQYNFSYNTTLTNPYTGATLVTRTYSNTVTPPAWLYSAYGGYIPQSGAYMNGSTSVRPNLAYEAQRDLMRAQRAMSVPGAYSNGLSAAKPAVPGMPGGIIDAGPAVPEGFGKAIAPADKAKVLSGEALNDLLQEIVKAEPKGGNRVSAFVPVSLLNEVRFGGSDAADALNLARDTGNLNFPAAFDDPALKDLRAVLARDFNAVAVQLRAGKSPDAAKRAQLEATLQKVEAALVPVVKNLGFEDATAARRFMNQVSNATKAMKAGAGNGLIDPKWEAEGTTTADLVKHMTKHKLQFAAAPSGNEESYTTLHRNLATYLFLLTQPKK